MVAHAVITQASDRQGVTAVLQCRHGWLGAVRGFSRPGSRADGGSRAGMMWGDAIVRFNNEPIAYAGGSTMDWPFLALASRAQNIVLFRLRSGDGFAERLAAITPRKLEGDCASLALHAVSPA